MAFTRIRSEIRALRNSAPGRRFEESFERSHVSHRVLRPLLIVLGLALMVVAASTFFLPGPQVVGVMLGLALVGGQSRTVARWLDRGELRGCGLSARYWEPHRHTKRGKAAAAAIVISGALLAWATGYFVLSLLGAAPSIPYVS